MRRKSRDRLADGILVREVPLCECRIDDHCTWRFAVILDGKLSAVHQSDTHRPEIIRGDLAIVRARLLSLPRRRFALDREVAKERNLRVEGQGGRCRDGLHAGKIAQPFGDLGMVIGHHGKLAVTAGWQVELEREHAGGVETRIGVEQQREAPHQ